jgi:hypothetical protein
VKPADWPPIARIAATLGAGTLGGAAFWHFHLTAPWLSGGMVAMIALIGAGIRPLMHNWLRDFGLLAAGAVTGSAITPEMLKAIARYPVSILLLAVTTWMIVVVGRYLLEKAFDWSGKDAFFASVPGALSAVIASTAASGGDMTRVVAVQAFRLFVLIAILPSAVMLAVREVPVPDPRVMSATDFAVMMLGSLAFAAVLSRVSAIAPYLFGGMAASAIYFGAGLAEGVPPAFISASAMLLVGIYAGSRFADLETHTLRALFRPSVALFVVSTVIAALGGILASVIAGVPIAEALVAFAPGGLEAMVLLGLAMGLDPLYVSAHHVARFVMISVMVPVVARRFTRENRETRPGA